MAVQLPGVSVPTQQDYDRIVAAMPGDTNAEKLRFFRRLVRQALRRHVIAHEAAVAQSQIPNMDLGED